MAVVRCPSCGNVIGERKGDTWTIRHSGRTVIFSAPEKVVIMCDNCGAIYTPQPREREVATT